MSDNQTTELATVGHNALAIKPVFSINEAIERRNDIISFVQALMKPDQDYGRIPGTQKDTLLKPGAEKLISLFGLTPRGQIVSAIEDFTGKDHNDEPFLQYIYRYGLYRGDYLVAEADGSCNSWEKKYRWREQERVCYDCGKPAIIKGKEEYGGGWLCFKKKGGCGRNFRDDDPKIVSQPTGQVPNPDIADIANTILKMAQKRALVAVTLVGVNASEFFTQDMEDMVQIPTRYSAQADVIEGEVLPTPAPRPEIRPSEAIRDTQSAIHHRSAAPEDMTPIGAVAAVPSGQFSNEEIKSCYKCKKPVKFRFVDKGGKQSLHSIIDANGELHSKMCGSFEDTGWE